VGLAKDKNAKIISVSGMWRIPTLIFFKEGKSVNQVVGAVLKSRLRAMIEESIKQGLLHFRGRRKIPWKR